MVIEGCAIARTSWGQGWCRNLERYSDYSNRLPRGRTYVRNGPVVDLQLARGEESSHRLIDRSAGQRYRPRTRAPPSHPPGRSREP